MERLPSQWDKVICKWSNVQGVNLQNIQTAYAAQLQKEKQHMQKTLGGKSK